MKFKRAAAAVCGAAIIAGAASFAGCEFLFGVKPKTFTAEGFSVELTTAYSRKSTDNYYNIMKYESDDILFSVDQIPREDICIVHVFDLDDFARYLMVDCYEEEEQTTVFKSEDGKLDGLTFTMDYTNSYGYRNIQSEYLFAGETYFYEISMVTTYSSYSSLKSDMEKIVLSCSAKDGLNVKTEVTPVTCDFVDMTICLDSTYVAKQDEDGGGVYYTNGGMVCYTYQTAANTDGNTKTLDDVQAEFEEMMEVSDWNDTENLETDEGVAYRLVADSFTDGTDSIVIMAALYVDSKGYGYIIEYMMFADGYEQYFIADAMNFSKATTFSVSE